MLHPLPPVRNQVRKELGLSEDEISLLRRDKVIQLVTGLPKASSARLNKKCIGPSASMRKLDMTDEIREASTQKISFLRLHNTDRSPKIVIYPFVSHDTQQGSSY